MQQRTHFTALPVALFLLLAAGPTSAALAAGGNTITVGESLTTCDYIALQPAIDAAAEGDVIHVSGSADHHRGNTYGIFSKSLSIRGGFDSCAATEPTGRTTLDAEGNGRVVDIRLQTAMNEHLVHLENLILVNGETVGTGAGVFIEGRQGVTFVRLQNVEVRSNVTTGNGGGLGLSISAGASGTGLILYIDDASSLIDNQAGSNGGGFSCQNGGNHALAGNLVLIDRASIFANQASNGGGVSAQDCGLIQIHGGGSQFLGLTNGAIAGNTATDSGGGVFLEDGSQVNIRGGSGTSSGFPVGDGNAGRVFSNQANTGGGAFVTGTDSHLNLIDAVVDANTAVVNGGGVYVADGAVVEVRRLSLGSGLSPCQPQESSGGTVTIPRCSRLKGNTADSSGGAAYVHGGELEVTRTIISGNHAVGNGSVVVAHGPGAEATGRAVFDDSLVHGNSGARLFYAWSHSDILVRWSTITDNGGPGSVFRAFTNTGAAQARVASSIVWEDGGNIMTRGGTGDQTTVGDCVLGHQQPGDIDATINFYHMANPRLMEPDETQPYFPGPRSPAIDFCHGDDATGDPDLAGWSRGTPHTGSPLIDAPSWSGLSSYDIGAYETDWDALVDAIFGDRYEQP